MYLAAQYGDYDPLCNYKGAITIGHLDTAPNEGDWADLVSDAPAQAIGHPPSDAPGRSAAFDVGASADLILFPAARRLSELLARPNDGDERLVLRKGRVQESSLPSYEALDDLVAIPTVLSVPTGVVQRGATKNVYTENVVNKAS